MAPETFGKDLITRRILVTKPGVNGKSIGQMGIRTSLGTNITRVNRNGVDLIATPHLKLQLGDRVTVVGTELAIAHTEKLLGNQMKRLNAPNLIPISLVSCSVVSWPTSPSSFRVSTRACDWDSPAARWWWPSSSVSSARNITS